MNKHCQTQPDTIKHPTLNKILSKNQPCESKLDAPGIEEGCSQQPPQTKTSYDHFSKLKANMAFETRSAPILAAAHLGLRPLHTKLLECLSEHSRSPSLDSLDELKRYFAILVSEEPPMSSPFLPAEQ